MEGQCIFPFPIQSLKIAQWRTMQLHFGGGCSITSVTNLTDIQFTSNSAYRAGAAIYYLDICDTSQPFEFCDANQADSSFSNNTAPNGENCASIITNLGFPPHSVPLQFVYPFQEFTLAFALVDQLGNILNDPDTIIVGNIDSDSEFFINLPDNTQSASYNGVYLFPECKFVPSSAVLPFHEIKFASYSPKYQFNITSNFTISTCPPNTESTSTSTSCIFAIQINIRSCQPVKIV